MKRFRMMKQKIVKPDGRWLYMYSFEEITEGEKTNEKAASQSDRQEQGQKETR